MEAFITLLRGATMFQGSDCEPQHDEKRLTKQLDVIRDVMLSASECATWLTLREISQLTKYGEASISAQLRNLRKQEFGGFVLEKRSRGERSQGLYEYRLTPPLRQQAKQLDLLEGRA
jgi:hypothetical protein